MEAQIITSARTRSVATIYASSIESSAKEQIQKLLDLDIVFENICIMPDVHAGDGCVIGFTAKMLTWIIPNIIGVDIGCGVAAYKLPVSSINFATLDEFIRQNIPHGKAIHSKCNSDLVNNNSLQNIYKKTIELMKPLGFDGYDKDRFLCSIGTLGSGNHFIEIDKSVNNEFWLTVHTGSRNFGFTVSNFFQNFAKLKYGGPSGLESLPIFAYGQEGLVYQKILELIQRYAHINRSMILKNILLNYFHVNPMNLDYVESVHNYIDCDLQIIRKGAISARKSEMVIIPLNMRDGVIMGKGLGNYKMNYSAPHGAGRAMSRTAAKKTLVLDKFKEQMNGIWTSCINSDTLDESPEVYKDQNEIMLWLPETVEIIEILHPVYNFKDSR